EVRKFPTPAPGLKLNRLAEIKIKKGLQKILKEKGRFQDWGGESNDLFSTRIVLKRNRLPAAFALKGKGTHGELKPKGMGKNGDQVGRLFGSPAQVYLVVYPGLVHESVLAQMQAFAFGKAISGQKIY